MMKEYERDKLITNVKGGDINDKENEEDELQQTYKKIIEMERKCHEQIKDHEKDERVTVTIAHAREMSANVGRAIARACANYIGNREISDQVMQDAWTIIKEQFDGEQ